jgi:hypothetical protein
VPGPRAGAPRTRRARAPVHRRLACVPGALWRCARARVQRPRVLPAPPGHGGHVGGPAPGVPERRSIQSVTLHLITLCLVLEDGADPRAGLPPEWRRTTPRAPRYARSISNRRWRRSCSSAASGTGLSDVNLTVRQVESGERTTRCVDRLRAERKHAEVVLAHPEAQQRPLLVLEGRHPVARRLFRLRHHAPNEPAYPLKLRLLRVGNSPEVVVKRGHGSHSKVSRAPVSCPAPAGRTPGCFSAQTASPHCQRTSQADAVAGSRVAPTRRSRMRPPLYEVVHSV